MATVYRRGEQFLIHGSSRTTAGVWVVSAPWLALPVAGTDAELEQAVRAALEGSRLDVLHPQSWAGQLEPLLALAGARSWSTFSKGATCVEIEEHAHHITLLPTTNVGPDEGFLPDVDRQVIVRPEASLAGALRALLDDGSATARR